MTDFDSMGSPAKGGAVEAELQDFLFMEKQRLQVTQQIHQFNDICWEKCVDKPGSKFDSKTETCPSTVPRSYCLSFPLSDDGSASVPGAAFLFGRDVKLVSWLLNPT